MATTRIWKVDTHLPRVLEYAKDESKTANPSWSRDEYQTMRDVMDYAMDDFKTEQQYYVTALNCNADCAREQMQMTKRQFGKTDGILAFHGYVSVKFHFVIHLVQKELLLLLQVFVYMSLVQHDRVLLIPVSTVTKE